MALEDYIREQERKEREAQWRRESEAQSTNKEYTRNHRNDGV